MSIPNSTPDHRRALVAGGRSWIGFHLAEALGDLGWQLTSTSSQEHATGFEQLASASQASALLEKLRPSAIVNLLIGTSEGDYEIHEIFLDWATANDAHYTYASSALALDGYVDEPLYEGLEANAVSEYGIFKARCERSALERTGVDALILRFSSIHGWSPYKDTRTVALLKRVAAGEVVEVSPGVMQNRLTDLKLSRAIAALVEQRATGIAHLGASDSSEEIDYLGRLARAFGFENVCIKAGEPRAVNLVTIPGSLGTVIAPTLEDEGIAELLNRQELIGLKRINIK